MRRFASLFLRQELVFLVLAVLLSVGAGVQIQYAQANLMSFNGVGGLASPNLFLISGDGWGWGFTAGATFNWAATQIGVGYRSQIDQDIEGSMVGSPGLTTNGPVKTTIALPDMVSVGLRQGIAPGWTLLGTFEWTNWSRLRYPRVIDQTTGLPYAASPLLYLGYKDGWFASLGAEYALTPQWTVRAGLAYEKSPIDTSSMRLVVPFASSTSVPAWKLLAGQTAPARSPAASPASSTACSALVTSLMSSVILRFFTALTKWQNTLRQ